MTIIKGYWGKSSLVQVILLTMVHQFEDCLLEVFGELIPEDGVLLLLRPVRLFMGQVDMSAALARPYVVFVLRQPLLILTVT